MASYTVTVLQGEMWKQKQSLGFCLSLSHVTELSDAEVVQPTGRRQSHCLSVLNSSDFGTDYYGLVIARPKMTSPVTKAMIESYALMVMVMGTFFVYFCGMVWAFCNPKLSGEEEQCGNGKQAAQPGDDRWICAPNPPERNFRCACAGAPHTAESLTQTTYINFWDDTDSLLSDCTAFCREDRGINNHIGNSPSWTA